MSAQNNYFLVIYKIEFLRIIYMMGIFIINFFIKNKIQTVPFLLEWREV